MFCSILDSGHTHTQLVMMIVMYADIAAHRAVRSWFLRLIVNVVICAPLLSIENKEYVPIYSCVVITKYDIITPKKIHPLTLLLPKKLVGYPKSRVYAIIENLDRNANHPLCSR